MTKTAPKPDLTVAELREAFIAEFGHDHPLFQLDMPTLDEAKKALEGGATLFQQGYWLNGGRAGMLVSLRGAIDYLRASLSAKDHERDLLAPLLELHRVLLDLEVTGNRAASLSAVRRGNPDSVAVADMKARAIVISNLLSANTRRSRKEADKLAADIISDAAVAVGTADRIDEKVIGSWRRSVRSRRTRTTKGAASSPMFFPKESLADRVEGISEEVLYKAGVIAHQDGGVCLAKLIEMILPPIMRMDKTCLALLRARVRVARGEEIGREDQALLDAHLKDAPS